MAEETVNAESAVPEYDFDDMEIMREALRKPEAGMNLPLAVFAVGVIASVIAFVVYKLIKNLKDKEKRREEKKRAKLQRKKK